MSKPDCGHIVCTKCGFKSLNPDDFSVGVDFALCIKCGEEYDAEQRAKYEEKLYRKEKEKVQFS